MQHVSRMPTRICWRVCRRTAAIRSWSRARARFSSQRRSCWSKTGARRSRSSRKSAKTAATASASPTTSATVNAIRSTSQKRPSGEEETTRTTKSAIIARSHSPSSSRTTIRIRSGRALIVNQRTTPSSPSFSNARRCSPTTGESEYKLWRNVAASPKTEKNTFVMNFFLIPFSSKKKQRNKFKVQIIPTHASHLLRLPAIGSISRTKERDGFRRRIPFGVKPETALTMPSRMSFKAYREPIVPAERDFLPKTDALSK